MNTLETPDYVRAVALRLEEKKFFIILEDDREIGVPYAWFPRLEKATKVQLENWRFIGKGLGIHWEDLDEDISVKELLKPVHPNSTKASISSA